MTPDPLLTAAACLEEQAAAALDLATELEAQAMELRAMAFQPLREPSATPPRVPYGKAEETVRNAVIARRGQHIAVTDLCEIVGLSRPTIDRAVRALRERGTVRVWRAEHGGRPSYITYEPPKPRIVNRPKRQTPEAEVVRVERKRKQAPSGRGARVARKDVAALLEAVTAAGAQIVKGKAHWKVTLDGRPVGTIPSSPSDHRALLNARSDLRRAGLDV